MLFADGSRYPGVLLPVGLTGQSLVSLVSPRKGSPVGASHDVARCKYVPVRGNQIITFETPAGPSRIHGPEITVGSQPNNLNRGVRRVFAAFPSSSCRYVNADPLSNDIGPDAVQSWVLMAGAKCSHGGIIHIVSACLRNILSSVTAYNVYYSITYAASTLNNFKAFGHSLRMLLGQAFCSRVYL